MNEENIVALDQLEPCGAGCPKPIFYMDHLTVDQLSEVGGGKHLRLRLSREGCSFGAIFFSTTALRSGIAQGDRVEIAFTPQINEFRGARSVQLNLVDIRPDRASRRMYMEDRVLVDRIRAGQQLNAIQAMAVLPTRNEFAAVWRYLTANVQGHQLQEDLACLSRKIGRTVGRSLRPGRLWVALQVFQERGLLTCRDHRGCVQITLSNPTGKVDLDKSPIMLDLYKQKDGD